MLLKVNRFAKPFVTPQRSVNGIVASLGRQRTLVNSAQHMRPNVLNNKQLISSARPCRLPIVPHNYAMKRYFTSKPNDHLEMLGGSVEQIANTINKQGQKVTKRKKRWGLKLFLALSAGAGFAAWSFLNQKEEATERQVITPPPHTLWSAIYALTLPDI